MGYEGYSSPTMEDNSTTVHLGISAQSWVLRITTRLQHIHRPTVKSKSRIGPCSRSSRPGSRGQRVSGLTSYQAYYGHIILQQGHQREKRRFDLYTELMRSSQWRQDLQAIKWRTTAKIRTKMPCAFSQTWWTRSDQRQNKGWHDTRISWQNTTTPMSSTRTFRLETWCYGR